MNQERAPCQKYHKKRKKKKKGFVYKNAYPLCCCPGRWSASGFPLGCVGLHLMGSEEDAQQGTKKFFILDYNVCRRGIFQIYIFFYFYIFYLAVIFRLKIYTFFHRKCSCASCDKVIVTAWSQLK